MADVYVETGTKRVVAAAIDWPGWCRTGKDEAGALAALLAAAPRYAQIVAGAGLPFEPPTQLADLAVRHRVPGRSGAADMGVPSVILPTDAVPMDGEEQAAALRILAACWATFDRAAEAAQGRELRKGPRGGGRDLEKVQRHVAEAEAGYAETTGFKPQWNSIAETPDPAQALAAAHEAVRQALAAVAPIGQPPPGPRGGTRWPGRYFVRRVAYHVVDHLWEIEDRASPD